MNITSADVDAMIERLRDIVTSSGYALGRAADGMSWFLDSIPGGEFRYTLTLDNNGLLLTKAERAQAESLVFATPCWPTWTNTSPTPSATECVSADAFRCC